VQQRPRPIAGQGARAPARVVDRQPERDLPAQIPHHRLHRPLIRAAGAVLQQQHLGQLRRRDRGTAETVRIAVSESSSRTIRPPCSASSAKNEPSGNGPISSAASKNPTCPVVVESMLGRVPSPDDTRFFSGLLADGWPAGARPRTTGPSLTSNCKPWHERVTTWPSTSPSLSRQPRRATAIVDRVDVIGVTQQGHRGPSATTAFGSSATNSSACTTAVQSSGRIQRCLVRTGAEASGIWPPK
jgi:hypothetical protein